MPVHDSLLTQIPEGRLDLDEEIGRIMSDLQGPPFNLRLPFPTDAGMGASWREASFGE